MANLSHILYTFPTTTPPEVSAQSLAKQSSTSYWDAQSTAGRERAGIQRDQTVQSLLFTQRGTDILATFLQVTGVRSRRWLLQGGNENWMENCWRWGSLEKVRDGDGEELE